MTAQTPAPRARRRRPPPGPPREVLVWRCLPNEGRGERRTLLDNVLPEAVDALLRAWPHGAGRFRLEFRDKARAVVGARYVNIAHPHEGGSIQPTQGRKQGPRKVPPPRSLHAPAPVGPLVPPAQEPQSLQAETKKKPRDPFKPPHPLPPGFMPMLHATADWTSIAEGQPLPAGYAYAQCSTGAWVVVPVDWITSDYAPSTSQSGRRDFVWDPPKAPPPPRGNSSKNSFLKKAKLKR